MAGASRQLPGAGSIRRLFANRQGNVAIEFAMLAPVLLMILVGGMEFGRLMWTVSGLHYATEEAARCYAMGICTATTAPTKAAGVAPELLLSSTNFTASKVSCGYQVVGTYQYVWVPNTTLFTTAAPNLSVTACFP